MNIYIVKPKTKEIQTSDFDGQMTSIYTYFNSLLVDNSTVLNNHVIYTNAQHTDESIFFIGEQLFIGDALILGLNGFEETDASIQQDDLSPLISFAVNDFYKQALRPLFDFEININDSFYVKDDEDMQINFEWVIYTFNKADEKTKQYFLDEMKKACIDKETTKQYFNKMAQLAVDAAKYQ